MANYTLRGHHLYQLYKAYQIKQRGIKRIWDYFAHHAMLGLPFFYVSDETFGITPKQIKSVKKSLKEILSDPDAKISFIDKADKNKDHLCESCRNGCPDNNFSAADALVLEMSGLYKEREYSIQELNEIAFSNNGWAKRYEDITYSMLAYGPFASSYETLLAEERKAKNNKK